MNCEETLNEILKQVVVAEISSGGDAEESAKDAAKAFATGLAAFDEEVTRQKNQKQKSSQI